VTDFREPAVKLISIERDERLKATSAFFVTSYEWLLRATAGAEENLAIQRKIIGGLKAYATLRADLKRGCLLPPLVLAARGVDSDVGQDTFALEEKINSVRPDDIYIIDGLQRTNAIRQTADELTDDALQEFLRRPLRVEVWLSIPFGALAYRMLLLNAGQRPMSIKHQVEILSMKLQEELSSIGGLEIFTSISGRRRTKAGQFQLAKLSQAFQAWLQGQPNVDLKNSVMEQLLADTAIEALGADIQPDGESGVRSGFKSLVEWMVFMDHRMAGDFRDFLANDSVLVGIAAAVGAAERNSGLRPRKDAALTLLKSQAEDYSADEALAVAEYAELRAGIDPYKSNVGDATRGLVFHAFQEFFISNGLKSMEECWRFAAGRV